MKILFMLPSLSVGGLERVQVTIANALAKKGHDVTVMTYMEGDALASELDERVRFIYKKRKPFTFMRTIPYIRHKFYDDGMWETRASAKRLYKYYVGKERYDVEIGFFRGMAVKTISGSTNKNSVKLAWVHSDFSRIKGYLANFKNIQAVKEAYKKFDKVVCVSNQAKNGFEKVIGDTGNLTTVYNLLPIKEIAKQAEKKVEIKIPKSKLNLVLVGRLLDIVKGQVRLINAVFRLRAEGYDLSLTLVGGGPDEEKIKRSITEKSAEKYIFMTGSQSNPYPYIKQSDLLVCASYFEGFNLTVAEALILGVPVLSTDCTGPKEILDNGKYGMLVENSEEGLYNGLKTLLDNPEKLQYYKEKSSKRIEFFNEEKILNQIEKFFVK